MSEKGTEKATEQRKEKARKKGDFVHSRELLSAVSMLAGVLVLGVSARQFLSGWDEVYTRCLLLGLSGMGTEDFDRAIVRILVPSLLPVGLILTASFSAALMA